MILDLDAIIYARLGFDVMAKFVDADALLRV